MASSSPAATAWPRDPTRPAGWRGGGRGRAAAGAAGPGAPGTGKRALARWGLLGEGAGPVFAAGARYPLAGLLLALPALEATGLLEAARQVYGRLCDG